PVLQDAQELPPVGLVVDPHQQEPEHPVADRVGGQQQGVDPQVQLIDTRDPAELLPVAAALSGTGQPGQAPLQAVVNEAAGQLEVAVASHGRQGPLDVEAVVEDTVEDRLADQVVVLGLGADLGRAGTEILAAATAGSVLCVEEV